MIKNRPYATLCLLVAFAGCSANAPEEIESASFLFPPVTIMEEDEVEPITRTSIQDGSYSFFWAQKDTVGIYPDSGSQVYFIVDIDGDATRASFNGGGWEFKPNSVYYSYYPFIGNIYLKRDHIPISYLGQEQTGTSDFSHIGPFDFMYTTPALAESGHLSFVYNRLGCFLRLRLLLPAGTYNKLAITAPDKNDAFVTSGFYDLTSSSPSITPTEYSNQLSINLKSVSSDGTEIIVYLMCCAPTDLRDSGFIVSALNSEKKEFQCIKTTSKIFEKNTLYKFGCTEFTAVPQSMGLIIDDWEDGGSIGGDAE